MIGKKNSEHILKIFKKCYFMNNWELGIDHSRNLYMAESKLDLNQVRCVKKGTISP